MIAKIRILILSIIIMTILSPTTWGFPSIGRNRPPERYDSRDNQYHKDGEGFYYVGRMLVPRIGHTATLLKDGRVFIAGGETNVKDWIDEEHLKSTEIFDPRTGKSVAGPDMQKLRSEHCAFLLKDGRVLLYGSHYELNNLLVEIYDPATNTIKVVGELPETYQMDCNKSTFVAYVSEYEVMFGPQNLSPLVMLDTRTDTIKYTDSDEGLGAGYYLGKLNDEFYFISGRTVTTYKLNSKNKLMTFVSEIFGDKYTGSNWGVILPGGKEILIVGPYRLGIFNIATKEFRYTPEGTGIPETNTIPIYPKELFALSTGEALLFGPGLEMRGIKVTGNEFNVIRKRYYQPMTKCGTKTELGNDEILYSGGSYVSISGSRKIRDKVYLWRRKDSRT